VSKVIDLRSATKVPDPTQRQPVFETTLLETLAIRKFIEVGISDLRAQVEASSKDGTPRKLFLAQKANAIVITAWLTSALMMVDGMLQEAATKSTTPLAKGITHNEAPSA
jgi:hypothetical protein